MKGLCLFAALLIIFANIHPISATESKTNLNIPPHIRDLSPDLLGPKASGVEIQWNATATDPENDNNLLQVSDKRPTNRRRMEDGPRLEF